MGTSEGQTKTRGCGNSAIEPRPHQQQCRSNIVKCYKSNDSFDKVECCFDNVAIFGNNVAGFGNNVEQKLKMLNLFRLWQKAEILQ